MFTRKPKVITEKKEFDARKLFGSKKIRSNKKNKIKKISSLNKQLLVFDVGSKTTKMISGKFRGNKIIVDTMNGAVNGRNTSFDGKLMDSERLALIVNKLLSSNNAKTKDAVFTVESTGFIRREMDIPNVPDQDMAGIVTYEINQYLPIDISSYVLQVKGLGVFEDSDGLTKKRVAVGAIPKILTESYVSFCDSVGLERYGMDMNSNALEKLITLEMELNPRSGFLNKNVVFIDMGHSFFNISIFGSGKYLFNKMIEIGGNMVDGAISTNMRIPLEEAEMIKLNSSAKFSVLELIYRFSKGNVPDTTETRVLRETLNVYDKWATEINQVLKYYTSRNRNNTINEIYIYGGCSFINGIDKYLEQKLQLPTNTYVNFTSVDIANQESNRNILNYLNAIGGLIRY